MRDGHTPRTLPPEWRSAAETHSAASLDADELLAALAGAPEPSVDLDFARHWAEFLRALADGVQGLGHEPSLAADFLRAGWEEFERLAAVAEGEAPPFEVGERFQLAAAEITDAERAHAVADGLRFTAGECEAGGDLSPLLEWRWRPRPPAEVHVIPVETEPAPAPEAPPVAEAAPVEAPRVPIALVEPTPPDAAMVPPPLPAEAWSAPASAVAESQTPPPLPPAAYAAAPPAATPALRPPSGEVLLLSRPTVARWFLERQLASAGLPVRVADNPEEAVHLLSRGRFRAILAEPELVVTGLWPWAQHAGVTRIVHLVPGALLGGTSATLDVLGLPPTEEEMERLCRGL